MGVLHLAASKDGGQELKSHLMLAIFYLATPIGLLRKDPVPLDLGPLVLGGGRWTRRWPRPSGIHEPAFAKRKADKSIEIEGIRVNY